MFRMFATIVLLSGIAVTQATDHYASLQYKSHPKFKTSIYTIKSYEFSNRPLEFTDIQRSNRYSFHDGKEPTPYNYNYGVIDAYAGTDFAHNEDSDGKNVKGSYTVQLPDGRRQTVKYVADHLGGFQAEVSYQGDAQYPKEYGPPVTFKPKSYH
ncbi:cuticle protein 8-like [Macrobrachium nipponense]|uniref:cuticle protein 8-like n=1 Tax=Macrobrachium nipponense TaxID=159736 RepID=UPI0030C85106